jgi:hypothetical protein
MPEDGRIQPECVACSDGFYKFVVSDGNKLININLSQYNGMNSIKTVELTTYHHLVPKLKMNSIIPPLP